METKLRNTGEKFGDATWWGLGSLDKKLEKLKSIQTNDSKRLAKYAGYFMAGARMFIIGTEVLAVFDLSAGIKAGTDPVKKAVDDYWMTGVGLIGVTSALFTEGDLKARSIKTGIAVLAGAAVILGINATFLT